MEAFYKTYKPTWFSFYKSFFLLFLILALAVVGSIWGPFTDAKKWLWIVAIVADIIIFIYIYIKRFTMSLTLRDNPDKPEDQEVAFVVYHPLKPFSSDFRKSVEIGLAKITDIKLGQNLIQTILGIGDIIITSAGTGDEEIRAQNIRHPQAVRDEIQLHARRYSHPQSTQTVEAH